MTLQCVESDYNVNGNIDLVFVIANNYHNFCQKTLQTKKKKE